MYDVTLRRVRESLLPWKSNKYYLLVCVCVGARTCLANPARNAYAPCCDVIVGPLGLHQIFRRYLINGAIYRKKVFEHKMCFSIFSSTFV
jgi:hypothetical protein